MENYRIQVEDESERNAVLDILNRSNDIVINNIEPTGIGITIQLDDAETAYQELLTQIENELHTPPDTIITRPTS